MKPSTDEFGINTIIIYVPLDIEYVPDNDGQNIFSHEAGHAIEYAPNVEKYIKWLNNHPDEKGKGGHGTGDKTGERANMYGKRVRKEK